MNFVSSLGGTKSTAVFLLIVIHSALANPVLFEDLLEEKLNLKEQLCNSALVAGAGAVFARVFRLLLGFVNNSIEAEMSCFKNDISVLNTAVHFFKFTVVGYVIHNGLFRAVAVRERNFYKNGAVRLNLISVKEDAKAPFTVTLALANEKAGRKAGKPLAKKAEAYTLQVSEKGITIVGSDERGLYYGVRSLIDMSGAGRLQVTNITD